MNLLFNYQFDNLGRTAETGRDQHIRDLIEQVLFTNPGERVNRPDFGCGLQRMPFEPNNSELAVATQYLVQGALNQWLSDLITVHAVAIESEDSTLRVLVEYSILQNQQRQVAQFIR